MKAITNALMIVNRIDLPGDTVLEAEDDSPVARDAYSPQTGAVALKEGCRAGGPRR